MAPWLFQLLGIAAAIVFLAGVRAFARPGPRPFAITLVIAALVYVGFALAHRAEGAQLLVETAGLALYGGLAWLGVRHSPAWLVAGWALHPAWDVGLHLIGPSAGIAPAWYAHACLTFDLVVAGALWVAMRRRAASPRTPRR